MVLDESTSYAMTTEAISTTTLLSATLDLESPYYLHLFESNSVKLVGDVLIGIDDYNPWALAMIMALKGGNKFIFVDGSLPMPDSAHDNYARWHHVNHIVMY